MPAEIEKSIRKWLVRLDLSLADTPPAASRLVSAIKNHSEYLGLRYTWKDVLPLVQALERAHPALARGGPHLEYPWEAGSSRRSRHRKSIIENRRSIHRSRSSSSSPVLRRPRLRPPQVLPSIQREHLPGHRL